MKCDMYYNSEYHDVKTSGEALRIRKSTVLLTGQTRAQLNFKGKKIDQISMSRQEYVWKKLMIFLLKLDAVGMN